MDRKFVILFKLREINQLKCFDCLVPFNVRSNTVRRVIKKYIEEGYFKLLLDSKGGDAKVYCLTNKGFKMVIKISEFLEIIKKRE